jgi:hypothetical protein
MNKFLTICFLAGLVSLPNITSTAAALPVPAPKVPLMKPAIPLPTILNTTSGKRVEQFAANLKADLDAQEAILVRYLKGLQADHENRSTRLKRLQITLSGLKEKMLNATQTYNSFNGGVVSQERAARPLEASFKRARDMYDKDMKNLKEEKEFVEALLKYIRLKKC